MSIIDRDVRNCLQSMKRLGEPIATTIERYVIWSFIDKGKINQCNDEKVIELGRKKLSGNREEQYIVSCIQEI